MKRFRQCMIMIATAIFIAGVLSVANAKGWESLKQEKVSGQRVMAGSEVEIMTTSGLIFVNTTRTVNIKIFTILGSRIADDNLSPGSYQFAVPTHGVYIIKAGDLTCKVAV